MIPYKLAKELKNAGFPQKPPKERSYWWKCDLTKPLTKQDTTKVYIPTLSELIEACGEGLLAINRIENYWQLIGGGIDEDIVDKNLYIAVARLWLKLNKK